MKSTDNKRNDMGLKDQSLDIGCISGLQGQTFRI